MTKAGVTHLFLGIILLLGIGYYGYRLANNIVPTLFESFLFTILLTSFSWLLSSSISRSAAAKKADNEATIRIDAIARQSSKAGRSVDKYF